MTTRTEITCFPDALLAGDELLGTGIGGHAGTVGAVRAYEDLVRIDFADGRTVALCPLEVCQVRREQAEAALVAAGAGAPVATAGV